MSRSCSGTGPGRRRDDGSGVTALAAEEAPGDVTVTTGPDGRDRIAGPAVRKVVSATQQGEDDYVASCEDGNRYRVFVNAEGRVVVEKLD